MDGILNVNKPSGVTSFGVVAAVKRLSGSRRAGHAGTLDPLASGVLPVCLGQATRVVQYLMDGTKTYRAEIRLGTSTDTYDACGRITGTGDASTITLLQVETALALFRGQISQTPPMYSALKHNGQPLYRLARAGIEVARKSRPTHIYRLEITDWTPPDFTLEVECSKGTYIRSLAHDLGGNLGCGAHLKNLIRTRYGVFDIKDAVSISDLEAAFKSGCWRSLVYPPDCVLSGWQAIIVDEATRERIRRGSLLSFETKGPDAAGLYCRAYALDGAFLGILEYDAQSGQWHPDKVFN